MQGNSDVLLFGSMGNLAEIAESSLVSHGLKVDRIPFPQNICKDAAGYERELFKALDVVKPGMVIPIGNTQTISLLAEKFPPGVIAAVGDASHITVLDSKTGAYELAQRAGVPVPKRYFSIQDVSDCQVIFKRDKSFGGSGVHRPRTKEALIHLIEHEQDKPFLIEDYIDGTDYSIDAFASENDFQYSCYRCISKKSHGPSISRECATFPLLGEYSKSILECIGYKGICGMDFKVDNSGEAWFLECNPRICGGLETQMESGFDIPWMIYKYYLSTRRESLMPFFA